MKDAAGVETGSATRGVTAKQNNTLPVDMSTASLPVSPKGDASSPISEESRCSAGGKAARAKSSGLTMQLESARRHAPGAPPLSAAAVASAQAQVLRDAADARIVNLRRKGRHTVVQERNIAQAPIFKVQSNDAPAPVSTLHGGTIKQVMGKQLTMRDSRMFSRIVTAWIKQGCQESGRAQISLSELARALGMADGGRQLAAMKDGLRRLAGALFESHLSDSTGTQWTAGWHLIDAYMWQDAAHGIDEGWVRLGDEMQQLIRAGHFSYMNSRTWDAIAAKDEVAGRLYELLLSYRLPSKFRVFDVTDDESRHDLAPLKELLGLDWDAERNIVGRLRQACKAIMEHDATLRLSVAKGTTTGHWNLVAMKVGPQRLAA